MGFLLKQINMLFKDRKDAGKQLAEKLISYQGKDAVIYALPRGGVIIGFEIAKKLYAPLDLIITRKIGHPYNPEYAICAITEKGKMVCNESERASLDPRWLSKQVQKEKQEAKRKGKIYLGGKKHISVIDKIAIIVDDGIATGLTIKAAIKYLKGEGPKKIIVAVPVAPYDTVMDFKKEVDEIVVIKDDKDYIGSVGAYYKDFPQVSDEEVISIVKSSNKVNYPHVDNFFCDIIK